MHSFCKGCQILVATVLCTLYVEPDAATIAFAQMAIILEQGNFLNIFIPKMSLFPDQSLMTFSFPLS